ncbi:ImpA family type VI secretion system protein [Jannaschia pohangensis]|uniref:Type VI secretion system protein ImpA n=1 Tax=Jannaschia pohangensis TaxID=390807 RepID=A0A1I3UP60_9RHOB|nr:type VI secretion system ImpA family N-terminal domain-containing protein [Jannaschia pohangensis]SFJ83651.1 type VI secretion system protein ImpA [Jannaschia pohangensis]
MPKGYDWAATPLDGPDGPCGPDLEATDDDGFVDWYYESIGRLPERYLIRGTRVSEDQESLDRTFDTRSVDIKAEKEKADGLLTRSRDIRILILMVRWELLAGRAVPASEALAAAAALLEALPDAVHPVDAADRRGVLADLTDEVTVIQPLLHLNLAGAQEVSLRRIRVATGEAQARNHETDLDASLMAEELARPANRTVVEANARALDRMLLAASTLRKVPRAPDLSTFIDTLTAMRGLLGSAAPGLAPAPVLDAAETDEDDDSRSDTSGSPTSSPQAAITSNLAVQPPTGPNGARLMLEACERYFRSHEPSSAALLLVTQARLLVGRPLMDALYTLMPEDANRATVSLGTTGFQLASDRLMALSDDNSLPPDDGAVAQDEAPAIPQLATAADVTNVLAAVEAHYALRERSSPVPLLLARARATIGKDFHALIAELIPPQQN